MPVRFCTSHIKHTFHRAIFVGLKNYIFKVHIRRYTSIILHTHRPPVYPTDPQAGQSINQKTIHQEGTLSGATIGSPQRVVVTRPITLISGI